jgi:hypothetical protein
MSSNKNDADAFAGVDFERDVQVTSADLEALAQARKLRPLSAAEYQEWVELIERYHPEARRGKGTMEGAEPFTLPGVRT